MRGICRGPKGVLRISIVLGIRVLVLGRFVLRRRKIRMLSHDLPHTSGLTQQVVRSGRVWVMGGRVTKPRHL